MKIVTTSKAPPARGAYAQGVLSETPQRLLFVSGQLPLDPESGVLFEGGLAAQTRRALDNVRAVVEAGGLALTDIAKTTVYITDIGDWETVNRIYADFFGGHTPARSVVPVKALHYGALIEVEAIASR